MVKTIDKLKIDLDGLGHTLTDNTLVVPIYQRSYAWQEKHVRELYDDIFDAIKDGDEEYFIGSVVISANDGQHEVIDGQQRIATVSILMAAIRDYFSEIGDVNRADDLQNKYLSRRIIRTQEIIPSLSLNSTDHDFYYKTVVLKPGDRTELVKATRESHQRIEKAYQIAKASVNTYISSTHNPSELLMDLCDFIDEDLKVIVVKVPNHANAYTIFETLNDRGLSLAISDLLKNYLLGQADNRIAEVQSNWSEMYSLLENTENEDLVVTFFRQYWSSIHGITRERELYSKIKEKINAKQKAVDLSINLSKSAKVYVSLIDTNQTFWDGYSDESKAHMASLNAFGMIQVRPLLLAIISNFSVKETEKALQFLVSASVRFLIHGGLGGGALESQYSERAKEISSKEISTTKDLVEKMLKAVPSDAQFQESFKNAAVSKPNLARYYLLALEIYKRGDPKPEFIPNSDAQAVNLEHILPKNPTADWNIDPDTHKILLNRIGNLAVMSTKLNGDIGNGSFENKKPVFQASNFQLTREVANYPFWDEVSIATRQEALAQLAVKAWPLK